MNANVVMGNDTRHGRFTTDHARSSYGLPVLVLDAPEYERPDGSIVRGAEVVVGPLDATRIYLYEEPSDRAVLEAARRAGYRIEERIEPCTHPIGAAGETCLLCGAEIR